MEKNVRVLLLKVTERFFLLEAAKYVLRRIAKEKVMGKELNIEGKELD